MTDLIYNWKFVPLNPLHLLLQGLLPRKYESLISRVESSLVTSLKRLLFMSNGQNAVDSMALCRHSLLFFLMVLKILWSVV